VSEGDLSLLKEGKGGEKAAVAAQAEEGGPGAIFMSRKRKPRSISLLELPGTCQYDSASWGEGGEGGIS